MDSNLISNWNAKVNQNDTIYHLGDFCFSDEHIGQSILDRLNGKKHLIIGNHDKVGTRLRGWESISHYKEVSIDGQFIILCHYAMRVWNKSHHGAIQLYGHSHGNLPGTNQSLDVGVDCWDYSPITLTEIKRKLKTLPEYKNEDHHGRK